MSFHSTNTSTLINGDIYTRSNSRLKSMGKKLTETTELNFDTFNYAIEVFTRVGLSRKPDPLPQEKWVWLARLALGINWNTSGLSCPFLISAQQLVWSLQSPQQCGVMMNGEKIEFIVAACAIFSATITKCYSSTKSAHENDPRFLVYCSICGKSMKKWSSLKKHLQREHRSKFADFLYSVLSQFEYFYAPTATVYMIMFIVLAQDPSNSPDQKGLGSRLLKKWICVISHAFWLASDLHDGSAGGCRSEDENSSDIWYDGQLLTNSEHDAVPSTPTIDPKWDQALFLLKATEQHSLTYSGIESLCECTQGLVETVLDQVASRVKKKLQEHNIEISTTLYYRCMSASRHIWRTLLSLFPGKILWETLQLCGKLCTHSVAYVKAFDWYSNPFAKASEIRTTQLPSYIYIHNCIPI